MSFEYYTNWWIKSKKKLEDLTSRDEEIRKKYKPITDRNLANELIGGMYAKYSMLVQDLCACVDQMAQPQKRMAAKKLVDSACIRLNEFNDELRKISLSEYHCIDGTLVELKLIPYDVEILHPCLFHHRPVNIEDMIQRIKKGERIFEPPVPTVIISDTEVNNELKGKPTKSVVFDTNPSKDEVQLENKNPQQQDEEAKKSISVAAEEGKTIKSSLKPRASEANKQDSLTLEEKEKIALEERIHKSIIMIQTAERARQDRLYFYEKNLIYMRHQAMRQPGFKKEPTKPIDPEISGAAATQIQKLWRGYHDRNIMKFNENKRRLLIGMNEPSWKSREQFDIMEANLEKRRQYRDEKIKEYIKAIDDEKARILRVVAPGLLEDIEDEIREWFHQWYVGARTFDTYPPEEKGGTVIVVRGETMTPKEYLDEYERKRREKVKAGGAEALKAKKAKEKKAKEEAEKKKKEAEKKRKEAEAKKKKKKKPGDYELEYTETLSKALRDVGKEEFEKIWNERNPFDNPEETYYIDLITEKHCYETQLEIRKQADALMRLELDMLQEALAKDKGKKYKKKKQKKKRKGRKKGKKDITADRMIEDLFQELVDNGIIRNYPKAKLEDFLGDFSYKNTELRMQEFDPPPTILDVRQAITLSCIQPLGVETMKKPRSVLIAGPRQSGLHLLANAIFNHTNCVLFDLSPEVTAGIYPGTKGLAMLIHLVVKMSKLLQPSIIYFEKAERIFYKKVPKDEKDLEPKRLGNKVVKGIIKTIKPEDRVLVLGITHAPWLGQAGKIKKAFERAILVPRPDYGSVYLWWRQLLMPYPGVNRDFNFTSISTVTLYQPYYIIKQVIDKVMTPRRIIQLKYKPLTSQELYEVFISNGLEPINDKEWKKYIKWYNKTPLGKERAVFNKWAEGKREIERKQQEKQQKGK
ncbi:IQ and AAA domain-containing protein 1-like [Anthonomus grandis grandis]|uniref:IQ and AAA domain-containing protein 1-like n=1 Tax=Anthonomus grandis grandis TaxID=2921223 RepID=UPI0021666717|nr:IQ and AAA domain-containing protein 1-like [Anthonomus grandis grandis]